MKKTTPALLLCVVLGLSANAQKFNLTPQVGIESSKVLLQFNNLQSFAPSNMQASPRLGLRMDYNIKKIGGPYVGLSTSRTAVAVNFANPEAGMHVSDVTVGKMQLRLEAGYQVSSKPIYLNKAAVARKNAAAQKAAAIAAQKSAMSRSGHHGGGYCSRYRSERYGNPTERIAPPVPAVTAEKGWYMSVQPSAGLAYIPGVRPSVKVQDGSTNINYLAGNMSTAFVAGTGFEFGENSTKKFVVGLQYIKGLGNLNEQTVSTFAGSKATATTLKSSVSGWNVSLGIPISLSKKKVVTKALPVMQEKKAPQQRSRCGGYSRYLQI